MSLASVSGVSFSQEILHAIVDALAKIDTKDLANLKSCSLAARALLPRAQYHIFAHIDLFLTDHGAKDDALTSPQSDAERLIVAALDPNPRLALFVRSVTLSSHPIDLPISSESTEEWSEDLEYLILSDPHLPPLFSRLKNIRTLKMHKVDLGYVDWHPLLGDLSATQVLASISAFFGDKPISTLVLDETGFKEKRWLTELFEAFQHIRTLDFTAVFQKTMFSIEAPSADVPDDSDYTPIALRNLVMGLSSQSSAELRGILQRPYPLSLSQLEVLEFRNRTIHDQSYFEDIEHALEMTRSSLKTAIFNFYWIEVQSSQFLSLQHLTDVRIQIRYCVPSSDSVIRNSSPAFDDQHTPRNQWRFWLRSLSQAEVYCMRHFTITIVLHFGVRIPRRTFLGMPESPRPLGLGLGNGPPSVPVLWVNGPNVNDLTALRQALMGPQFQDLQSVTVLIDFNLDDSRFHPGLLPPRLREVRDAFQPLVDARRYTFNVSVIGDQTPPPEELLSQPCELHHREDMPDSEAEEEEERQEEFRRLHEIIKPTSALNTRNVMIKHWINLDPERNRYKVEFEKWISQVPQKTQDDYYSEEKKKRRKEKAAASGNKKKTAKK